jgi:hypothetical protein
MEWKTKNGEILDVKDMTDSHLLNAINYIKRTNYSYRTGMAFEAEMAAGTMMGEMAQDSLEGIANSYYNATDQEILKERGYYKLLAEKRKRNL